MTVDEVVAAGGYRLVYADPAWQYAQRGVNGAAERHYSTMTLADICALPVGVIAPNAVLFMWVTWPSILVEVPRVLDAWGFKYKTCGFLWVKHRVPSGKRHVGTGFWTRANSEVCIVATRGDYPRRVDAGVRQVVEEWAEEPETIDAPLGEHSAKPAEVRDRIVQLMGDVPRIELFARERAAGWDAWGDDPRLGEPDVALR